MSNLPIRTEGRERMAWLAFAFAVAAFFAAAFGTVALVATNTDWHQEFFELGELIGQLKAGMESINQ